MHVNTASTCLRTNHITCCFVSKQKPRIEKTETIKREAKEAEMTAIMIKENKAEGVTLEASH